MKTRLLTVICLAAVALAACGGAKFAEEKTLLTTLTGAMETFTKTMESADTPEIVTQALGKLTGSLDKVMPAMKKLTAANPDWETKPPKELEDVMSKFKSASSGLQGVMPKLMSMAQEHGDNADLQNAVQKFTGLMSQL